MHTIFRCENCEFWNLPDDPEHDNHGQQLGECRRRAPFGVKRVPDFASDDDDACIVLPMFPPMPRNEKCGEIRLNESAYQ